jgi:MoxR-like ATPase
MSTTTLNPIDRVLTQVRKVVVGYPTMTELVAYALFADGHVLLEGLPGLAKTMTARGFGRSISDASWKRIQMKPDILPSDIVGAEVYNKKTQEFSVRKGPIFANVVLADEINRAAPRSQSALLEAMAEKSTSLAGETHAMPELFCVLATMNPIEQEGTFPLPEAQLDRFLFKVTMGYAARDDYRTMLRNQKTLKSADPHKDIVADVSIADILAARAAINEVHVSDAAIDYILDLVDASRPSDPMFSKFVGLMGAEGMKFAESILVGGSPRAYQAVQITAQVRAFHMGRGYVLPEDVQYVAASVLRHRLILQRKARMEKKYTTDDAVNALIKGVPFHNKLEDYSN